MSERTLQHINPIVKAVRNFADHPARLVNPRLLFGEVLPYSLEAFPLPCPVVEHTGYNLGIINALMTPQLCQEVANITSLWTPGQKRGTVINVGSIESGSKHPHLFEIAKTETGTRMLLVDPEDSVGRRNLLKPRIVILLSAHIENDSYALKIAYVRHRSNNVALKNLKLAAQYGFAEELFQNQGIPSGVSPEDVTFRLLIDQFHSLIQCPLGTKGQLEKFFRTQTGHLPAEERLVAIRDNLHLIPRIIEAGGKGEKIYQHVLSQVRDLQKMGTVHKLSVVNNTSPCNGSIK